MQLFFVDSDRNLSRRDHELREQAARSHAATISHRRAGRQTKGKPRSKDHYLTASPCSLAKPVQPDASSNVSTALNMPLDHLGESDAAAVAATANTHPDFEVRYSSAEITPMLLSRNTFIGGKPDPFDALPVRNDRQVHEFIMYYRDMFFFPRHGVDLKTWPYSQSAVADWRDFRESLHDPGQVNAFLAQTSAVLALETPSRRLVESSLAYIQKSSVVLRTRLRGEDEGRDFARIWRHIGMLQNAELLLRNREAAVVHGKMSRRLFDQWIAQGKEIDVAVLLQAVYVDLNSAITFWIRPNFEPSAKLVEAFPEISSPLLGEAPVISAPTRFLDDQVSHVILRNIFLRWDQFCVVKSFHGRRLWTCITQLQVIHFRLDVEEKLSQQLHSSAVTFFHAQAYISLAALYWIRITTVPEHFVRKPPFDAHTSLLKRLRYHLEVSEFLEDEQLYSRARFWALFVGAHSEHQAALLNQSPSASPSGGWFNIQLAQQANRCGLPDWTSAKEVLQGFMYCDVVPDPSEWYVALLFGSKMLDLS